MFQPIAFSSSRAKRRILALGAAGETEIPHRCAPRNDKRMGFVRSNLLVPYANSLLPGTRFDHLAYASARFGFGLTNCGQRTIYREIVSPGNQKLLSRETRYDLMAGFGDDDFFLDTGGAPAIGRWPESFQREDHARLDFARMLKRYETADYRLFPDGETDAVTILESEGSFLVGEAKLRPHP